MNKKVVKLNKVQKDKLYVVSAFSLLATLFALYIYFVSVSVVHVVIQQEIEQNISALHSEISSLEADYIAAQHTVSADIASLQGYVEASNKIFIERTSDTLVLSKADDITN